MIAATTVLSRLLSSDEESRRFFRDRTAYLAALDGVLNEDEAALLSLSQEQLDKQREMLIRKRAHEVQKITPWVAKELGAQFYSQFREFAQSHWPRGHARHRHDARAFIRYLLDSSTCMIDPVAGVIEEFALGTKRFGIRWETSRLGVLVLWRTRGVRVRYLMLFFRNR